MKIYKVIHGNSVVENDKEIFFTSREKALGYIIGFYSRANEKPRAITKRPDWWNGQWCYNEKMIFDIKNWNKYKFIIGNEHMRIEAIEVY